MREIEYDLLRFHSLNNSCNSNRSSVCSNSIRQQQNKRMNSFIENGNHSKSRLSSTDSAQSNNSFHRKLPHISDHVRNLCTLQNLPDYVVSVKHEHDVVNVFLDDKQLKPDALLMCLHFIYFGDLPSNVEMNDKNVKNDILLAAEILQLKHLVLRLSGRSFGCELSGEANKREFLSERNSLIAELGFELSLFTGTFIG